MEPVSAETQARTEKQDNWGAIGWHAMQGGWDHEALFTGLCIG